MPSFDDLPEPSNDAKNRSAALLSYLRQEMAKQIDGSLTFDIYMKHVLYHPEYGYYCAPQMTLGKHGDFTTAPEISSLFGQCIAQQLAQVMIEGNLEDIYELGAGSGKLAGDILQTLDQMGQLPAHYYIYEISSTLRNKQKNYIKTHCPKWLDRIIWLDVMPTNYQGIVIANEVLDALPVSLFTIESDYICERCVTFADNRLQWQQRIKYSDALISEASHLRNEYDLYPGYSSEINLSLKPFMQEIVGKLSRGIVFFFDYGYGQTEYYHPQRQQGTLTCFYQHRRHANPLLWPGLQDITAHVDFTRVIEIAADLGCDLAGFTTQAAFLLACGLMDHAAKIEQATIDQTPDVKVNLDRGIQEFELHQAIKLLTMPTEMGERIKVMALSKNCDLSLQGFSLQDRSRDL